MCVTCMEKYKNGSVGRVIICFIIIFFTQTIEMYIFALSSMLC